MKREKYTKENLETLAKDAISVSDILRSLGLALSGGNHSHIKSRLVKFDIDVSHFVGSRFNAGERHMRLNKLSHEVVLSNNRLNGRREQSHILRRALVSFGVKEICSICGCSNWNGKELRLQIDHINGDGCDNRPENLRFLCPNCHSQTENFGSKNKK